MSKSSKNAHLITIIDDSDDFGAYRHDSDDDVNALDQADNFITNDENDDFVQVIVNAEEFISELNSQNNVQNVKPDSTVTTRSASPPRKTVQLEDDGIVYRNKQGKRITKEQWLLLHQRPTKKPKEPAQELKWGKGLVQIQSREEKIREEQKIASQPLNRYDIDEDYDRELRERSRWHDPLNSKQNIHSNETGAPSSRFHGVPNRFDINPGYRWDGVIRGNGYEQRWFRARNDGKVRQDEFYLNNVADM